MNSKKGLILAACFILVISLPSILFLALADSTTVAELLGLKGMESLSIVFYMVLSFVAMLVGAGLLAVGLMQGAPASELIPEAAGRSRAKSLSQKIGIGIFCLIGLYFLLLIIDFVV